LNTEGDVVGVTTAIWRESQNLNFGVSVEEIRRFLNQPCNSHGLRPRADSDESNSKIADGQKKETSPQEQPPKEKWTREEKEDIDHFVHALRLYNDAGLIALDLIGMEGLMAKKTFKQKMNAMVQAANEAYEQSQLVRRVVLDKLHPSLASVFKASFIPGIKGEGNALVDWVRLRENQEHSAFMRTWNRWWDANHMDLEMPDGISGWDYKARDFIHSKFHGE
jgi:hypothetical protein